MKRLAIPVILALLVMGLFFQTSVADEGGRNVQIAKTSADTASILLPGIRATQRYKIKNITVFYDNAANTNPLYVAIQLPSYSQTVYFWAGQAMTSSGITTVQYTNVNAVVSAPADSTAGGLRFFISAASSDTLFASLDYDVITY